jgi:hypothetical protein
MTYINKINPKINLNNQKKYIYNGVIITFLILFAYFIFFNNISLFTVTTFLFDSDLGRISLLVVLIAIASCNLFLGILLLGLVIFLYEYQHTNISKYNNKVDNMVNNMVDNMDGFIETSQNKKNITIQDIINLENNISSKQSNSSLNFDNVFNTNTNNSNIMQIRPSFEGTFSNNYAPFLQ